MPVSTPSLLRLAALAPAAIVLSGCTLAHSDAATPSGQEAARPAASVQQSAPSERPLPPSQPEHDTTGNAEEPPSTYQNPELTRERIERYKERIGPRPQQPG